MLRQTVLFFARELAVSLKIFSFFVYSGANIEHSYYLDKPDNIGYTIFTVIVLQKLAWPATEGVSAETPFYC